MEKKSLVEDNVSSNDQISHGFVSSVSDDKTSKHNSRDADTSAVSSERVHSSNQTFISDLSSEIEKPLKEKRKSPSTVTSEVISQGDSTIMVPYPNKQLKADSSSSKNSVAVGQLSSIDSVDPKSGQTLNNHEYSNQTRSVESNKGFQDPECSASKRTSHHEFDLNEGFKATNDANWLPKLVNESNYSEHAAMSEPIPVAAKLGVPMGLPKKPLQFGGDRGWKSSGSFSAFRSTRLANSEKEKTLVSKGFDFDLNVAATMDQEDLVYEASDYVSSKQSEKVHYGNHRGNENYHRSSNSCIDLNNNPMIEDASKTIYPKGETRQLLPVTYSGSNTISYPSNFTRPPYWVDMSSVRGFGNVQGQPILLGGPTMEQSQMLIPIQLPYTPPGLYVGKPNNLNPAFYPNVLPPFHNQPMPGPVLAAYHGNVRLLENSHAYMRQTAFPTGNIAFMDNERMKTVEQVAYPDSSMKRRDSDGSCGASQVNCRQLASWN